MTDAQQDDNIEPEVAPAAAAEAPQYGVGPFSIREVALGGVWLVAFILSFFSISTVPFASVWSSGILWILTIGLPTVAVFLIGLRRLSPEGIRRVGSLGIDQFASVAFSVASIVWLQLIWETVAVVVQEGPWLRTWVIWVEFVLMLAGVVLTVFATLIPPFADDFRGRREVPAHRNARPIRPVTRRPAPVRPVAPQRAETADAAPAFAATTAYDVPGTYEAPGAYDAPDAYDAPRTNDTGAYDTGAYDTGAYDTGSRDTDAHDPGLLAVDDAVPTPGSYEAADDPDASIDALTETTVLDQVDAEPEPVRHQAFWALAPEERDVVDESGAPIFRIGPSAWALVIEDRGAAFVVRHEDGRIGFLHEVDGVTRG